MHSGVVIAFAALLSIVSILGIVSISEESDSISVPDGVVSIDWSDGEVVDLSDPSIMANDVDLNIDVVDDGAFGFFIPLIFPEQYSGYNSGYNSPSGYDFVFEFTDDGLFVVGDANGSGVQSACVTARSSVTDRIQIYLTFNPVPLDEYVDHSVDDVYSSITSEGVSFTIPDGEPFEYTLPGSFDSMLMADIPNTDFPDFVSLSEDGMKLIIDTPVLFDSSVEAYSIYLSQSCDPFAGLTIKFRVAFDDWTFDYDKDTYLAFGVDLGDGILLSPLLLNGENGGYFDFEVSSLPSGLKYGHVHGASTSYSTREFRYSGTPDVKGDFPITVTATDKYLGTEYSFDIIIHVGDFHSVIFAGPSGSVFSSFDVFEGLTISSESVPVVDDPLFGGWFSDSECTVPFDFDDPILSDTVVYSLWGPSEPEPEPPVSEGVVSPEESERIPDSLILLAILGLVVVVGLLAIKGAGRR